LCEAALQRGVFAQAIGLPATPAISSCVRLAVMASHRSEELRAAARVLAQSAAAVGLDPRATAALLAPDEEPYDGEQYVGEPLEVYDEVDPSVPYDFEQTARAA
jgi:hypothetical protein